MATSAKEREEMLERMAENAERLAAERDERDRAELERMEAERLEAERLAAEGKGKGDVDGDDDGEDDLGGGVGADEFLDSSFFTGKKVKLKIDGEEREASVDEIVRNFQINQSADKRMQDAAKLEESLRAREAALQQAILDIQKKSMEDMEQAKARSAAQAETKPSEKDAYVKAVEALLEGDEAKAAEVLKASVNLSAEMQARSIVEKVLSEREAEIAAKAAAAAKTASLQERFDRSLDEFAKKRQDIASDENLSTLFDSKLNKFLRENMAPELAVEKAGEEVDVWLSRFARKDVESDPMAERKARKESLKPDGIVSRSGVKAESTKRGGDDDVSEDVQSVIAQMRKARGM